MNTVTSADGTAIAYERLGDGPAVVLVDGALCHRAFGPSAALAKQLASHFSVFWYDRRGRGDSGRAGPATIAREIEDLQSVIDGAGGKAFVCGVSSGAALALEAANRGAAIAKLALYEMPIIVDDARAPIGDDYLPALKRMIEHDRRSDAVRYCMKAVQVPAAVIALMRLTPAWRKLKAVAPTLPNDVSLVEPYWRGRPLPPGRWNSATVPALVLDGSKSPLWMRNAQRALAAALPNARARTLAGQTHMVNAKVLAPVLIEFFDASC